MPHPIAVKMKGDRLSGKGWAEQTQRELVLDVCRLSCELILTASWRLQLH